MKFVVAALGVMALCFAFAHGQNGKAYQAVKTLEILTIDGDLSEKSWKEVKWAGNFIQTDPQNGAKPRFRTQFKILLGAEDLYVAIRAFDKEPDKIQAAVTPRDFFDGDWVEINIDSDHDKKDAFSFTITASGMRGDEYIQTSNNWINDWNPNWTAKTQIDDKGWIAEIKIPYEELEIREKKEVWGIQVNRNMGRMDESASWTPVPDEDKWVGSFGELRGVSEVPVIRSYGLDEKIRGRKLQNDLARLQQNLRASYPSLYRYRSKEFIDSAFEMGHQQLHQDRSPIFFYKTVSSILSLIGDGHMKVSLPKYLEKSYLEKAKRIPLKLKTSGSKFYVVENHSGNEQLDKAQIVAINGRSAEKVIHEMSAFLSSDGYNQTGKYHRISADIDFFLFLVFGFQETIALDFVPENEETVLAQKLTLLDSEAWQATLSKEAKPTSRSPFRYEERGKLAILSLNTFNNAGGFKRFVDTSFQKMASSGIEKLILDLRGNGGGEELNAIHLYSYLSAKPFQYYDRYGFQAAPKAKIAQEASLFSFETLNFYADFVAVDEAGRRVLEVSGPLKERFVIPNKEVIPKKNNHFDGPVIVLIDGRSFSATSEICAIMKRDGRAMFVGEETGGGFDGNTSGIYDHITLPHSKLKIKVPLLKYVMETGDADYEFGRGVMPDFQFPGFEPGGERDKVLEFAIKYLND